MSDKISQQAAVLLQASGMLKLRLELVRKVLIEVGVSSTPDLVTAMYDRMLAIEEQLEAERVLDEAEDLNSRMERELDEYESEYDRCSNRKDK